ncbi:hypothetical protein [Desulfosporosinus sp.]|uniref:hypothetical protein n=1 Tax=Desulfosporosinus sp. TaxID=157907 RepID=UPI0025C72021|nr:hypothetical protein [Desulfosporosinus sp.]MBC2726246.1 hypothetical protein [Desulfosporosinus sp.]
MDKLEAIAFSSMIPLPNKSPINLTITDTVATTRDDICHCFLPPIHSDVPDSTMFVRVIGYGTFSTTNTLNIRLSFKDLSDNWLTSVDSAVVGAGSRKLIDTGWKPLSAVPITKSYLKSGNPTEFIIRLWVSGGSVILEPNFTVLIGIRPSV